MRDLFRLQADLGIDLVLWKKETANASTCSLMLGTLIFARQAMKRGEEFAARLNVIALSHTFSPHRAGVSELKARPNGDQIATLEST